MDRCFILKFSEIGSTSGKETDRDLWLGTPSDFPEFAEWRVEEGIDSYR